MTCPFFRLPPQEKLAYQPFTTNFIAQQIQKSHQVGPFFSGSLRLKALQSELEISKALFAVFAEGSCSPQMCLDQPSQGIFGIAYRQRNKVYPHDEDLSSMCVKKSSCSATWHSNVCFFVEISLPENGVCTLYTWKMTRSSYFWFVMICMYMRKEN